MSQTVYSFSIRKSHVEHARLMEELKKDCDATGQSFSYVVLEALKEKYGRK